MSKLDICQFIDLRCFNCSPTADVRLQESGNTCLTIAQESVQAPNVSLQDNLPRRFLLLPSLLGPGQLQEFVKFSSQPQGQRNCATGFALTTFNGVYNFSDVGFSFDNCESIAYFRCKMSVRASYTGNTRDVKLVPRFVSQSIQKEEMTS